MSLEIYQVIDKLKRNSQRRDLAAAAAAGDSRQSKTVNNIDINVNGENSFCTGIIKRISAAIEDYNRLGFVESSDNGACSNTIKELSATIDAYNNRTNTDKAASSKPCTCHKVKDIGNFIMSNGNLRK